MKLLIDDIVFNCYTAEYEITTLLVPSRIGRWFGSEVLTTVWSGGGHNWYDSVQGCAGDLIGDMLFRTWLSGKDKAHDKAMADREDKMSSMEYLIENL